MCTEQSVFACGRTDKQCPSPPGDTSLGGHCVCSTFRSAGSACLQKSTVAWTFTGTSWSNRVLLRPAGGAPYLYRFSRRERPHLVFGRDGAIEALTTGVQFGSRSPISVEGEDACYTQLQRVGV